VPVIKVLFVSGELGINIMDYIHLWACCWCLKGSSSLAFNWPLGNIKMTNCLFGTSDSNFPDFTKGIKLFSLQKLKISGSSHHTYRSRKFLSGKSKRKSGI